MCVRTVRRWKMVINQIYILFSNNAQCQELKNELKRVKRQLLGKNSGTTTPQCKCIIQLISIINLFFLSLDGPTLEYEQLRRKIETQARELSYFTSDQLNKISEKLSEEDKQKWKQVIERFSDQNRYIHF